MYAVSVKAFADALRLGHEACEGGVGRDDVRGGYGFVLIEAPDVQFVDGSYARNLGSKVNGLICVLICSN